MFIHCLSLTQPWATLVAAGGKQIETRSWPTKHRGLLAIHASQGWTDADKRLGTHPPFSDVLYRAGVRSTLDLPRGTVVALCRLIDCVRTEDVCNWSDQERAFGDYTPGRWAWRLTDVYALPTPIPARGRLGLWPWDCPDVVLAASGLAPPRPPTEAPIRS